MGEADRVNALAARLGASLPHQVAGMQSQPAIIALLEAMADRIQAMEQKKRAGRLISTCPQEARKETTRNAPEPFIEETMI